MGKPKKTKFVYLFVALALIASLVPLTAVPVGANAPPPALQPALSLNVIGDDETFTGVNLNANSKTVASWEVQDNNPDPDAQITAVVTGGDGAYVTVRAFKVGEATVIGYLNAGKTEWIDAVKKWGKIDSTSITPPQSKAVTWNEEAKIFEGSASITDTVTGRFFRQDGTEWTDPVGGAVLHWFLLNIHEQGKIPMGPDQPENLLWGPDGVPGGTPKGIAELAPATFTTFVTTGTNTQVTTSAADGTSTVSVKTIGEEAVIVVVVPDYPFDNNETVSTEITKLNFYTVESEKVPQVRWAGEKIVLEKFFGTWATGLSVRFALEQQSVGVLEAMAPNPFFPGQDNQANTVWSMVDAEGRARVMLVSEDQGEADVMLTLYSDTTGTDYILNQHGFVGFFLKLEEITLGNVEGKRTLHNAGDWVSDSGTPYRVGPYTRNPTSADQAYDPKLTRDMTSERLNVSEDTLLRARVKGWFVGDNLSGRPERLIDTDPQVDSPWDVDTDPTNDPDLLLPRGRWVLPDDWPMLAGPDWKQLRIHWDIMDQPDDAIMSVHNNELGPYTDLSGHGTTVAAAPVIGPFNPGWELPTPTGYNPNRQAWAFSKTVVPNGVLNWWDAPMPPAKITFKIKSGPGFFKEADKGLIYYSGAVGSRHYTNPFYQIMVAANDEIPAMVNNGGYDWDSWNNSYGPYDFWYIMNRPENADRPSSDMANYPTKVQVYSDNHGEAMVFLNGDWNLDPSIWPVDNPATPEDEGWVKPNGAWDIPYLGVVGTTYVEAKSDYPYFRKHPALVSNPVEKIWTWGQEKKTDVEQMPQAQSTNPYGNKLVTVWVRDRDGFADTGMVIEWRVATAPGLIYDFLPNTNGAWLNVERTVAQSVTRGLLQADIDRFRKAHPSQAAGLTDAQLAARYAVAGVYVNSEQQQLVTLNITLNRTEGVIEHGMVLNFQIPSRIDPLEPLTPSWNLIVYYGATTSVATALTNAVSAVEAVWSYDNVTKEWKLWSPGVPAHINTLQQMQQWTAYWIKVTQSVLWQY